MLPSCALHQAVQRSATTTTPTTTATVATIAPLSEMRCVLVPHSLNIALRGLSVAIGGFRYIPTIAITTTTATAMATTATAMATTATEH